MTKLFSFLLIILLYSNCKSREDFSLLSGEFLTNQIKYKDGYLDGNGYPYLIYFDQSSGWVIMEQNNNNIKAKYKIYRNKDKFFLNLSNSNDKRVNGNYLIKIDTILKSKQRDEFIITMQSKEIQFSCAKAIVKKIGR